MQEQALRAGRIPAVAMLLLAAVLALVLVRPAFAAPAITSVAPNTGSANGGTVVTITGSELSGVTAVTFGGTPGTNITANSANSVTVTAPAHAAGTVDVVVTATGGTVTSANGFTYVAPPTVTNVTPATGGIAGGTSVTITGTNLTNATSVTFGGTAGTNVLVGGPTSLTVTTPAHAAGEVDVIVTTTGGGASATNASAKFTYVVLPTVTALNPAGGPAAGGNQVIITGTGLTGATSVTFGGNNATTYTVNGATQITATAPAHGPGLVDVLVTTPTGTNTPSTGSKYLYGPVPAVTSLSPTSGPAGTTVTITGTGLTGATSVNFDAATATPTSVTDTQLTVVAPAHALGAANVTVVTPTGTSPVVAAGVFTYTAAATPVVTSLSPAGGPIAGGTVVTITGTGFTGATAVSFGGTPATAFTVTNSTTISATAPAHAAGLVDVLVTTPAGTSVVATGAKFLYGPAPAVTAISPTTGTAGTVVTITGTGLTGATSVKFGDATATPTSVTDTTVVVTAPSHAAGAVDVQVVTPTGTSPVVTAAKFTYGGSTTSYTLSPRWSLIVWQGVNGISVMNALRGQETPDNTATNNISSQVTAIFRWNGTLQKWEAFFPGTENVPGANDFTTLTKGVAYWIAINATSSVTWTIEVG